MISEIYSWLVHQGGLYYAFVGWAVAWLSGLAVAWRPWHKHRKAQQEQLRYLQQMHLTLQTIESKQHDSRPRTHS